MAITKDTTSSAVGGSATSLTWAHTVGTGSNTILVVAVRISSGTATVTGVTYNAVSMTQLTSKVQGSNTVYLFYILLGSTTSASHNIVASFSATVTSIGVATSYFNVAQSGTWGTAATSSGASGNSSNTVTTTSSSQEVVDINYELGTTDATSGASQTKEVSNGTSALGWLDFGDIAATGSSMSLSWTNPTNTAWIELSAAMNVAGTRVCVVTVPIGSTYQHNRAGPFQACTASQTPPLTASVLIATCSTRPLTRPAGQRLRPHTTRHTLAWRSPAGSMASISTTPLPGLISMSWP